jgi:transcription-repair coupling factor (superfamily II helicase)
MADPTLHGLVSVLEGVPDFQQLCEELQRGQHAPGHQPLGLELLGAARPYVVAALAQRMDRPIVVLTARPEVAIQFQEQMRLFLSDPGSVWNYPDPGALPYERAPWSVDRVQRRLAVLTELTRGETKPVIITSARAVLHPTLPRDLFERNVRTHEVGKTVSLKFLLASWYAMGYTSTNIVSEPGQFSHRGGILDIFPTNRATPVRIELWGDDIDSIRTFDPLSQRSIDSLKRVTIPPATEALLPRNAEAIAERLRALDCTACVDAVQAEFAEDTRRIAEGERFEGVEFFMPYLYEQMGSLFDYLPADALLLVDDWTALEVNVEEIETQALQRRNDMIERGELPARYEQALFTWDDLRDWFSQRPPVVLGYGAGESYGLGDLFSAGQKYGGRLQEAIRAIRTQQGEATQVLLTRQAERMAELLRDEGVVAANVVRGLTQPPVPGALTVLNGALNEGFQIKETSEGRPLHLITDAELFGWSRVASRRPMRPRKRPTTESFFAEIKEGDFVVHTEHGIGLFRGLVQREVAGVTREYLELEYGQGDKLYVPVHQADRVARYVGPSDQEPTIHRLGTADWETARRRAQKAVEEIADELLELYAARATVRGHAYSEDTPWQAEMEASFPYAETEDQLRTINEVKTDMENVTPMDRLVIGDVGFGKTEVALRAAFKAVMDGKQVGILVPTTVLAQQHYTNFTQRLAPYPVTVEMLSRFRTPKEQDNIVERLAQGQVDIIVGTHRLLSKDVAFKDLGLVIIDEEQRFGVTHKEQLKQLRKEVDVLTLTATPIPRTLHMALTGARDMSTIDTPPEERLPVITKASEWDDSTVRRAILLEIDRGGQVFFVHNRVLSIYAVAQRVGKLVPEARIAVAHGQMNEHELEAVMVAFANGEYDVLACTSIIESGLDLPNVNTIIIDHAEMFGLAQLYQLRGRVGRGARRGYAYFVHPRATQLTPESVERLEVMQEATELGAGFRVALRDLEIRGAGELLGARQSGNIAAVGFDMFTRLLQQAIRERRDALERPNEQSRRARVELSIVTAPTVELPLQAYLPDEFIAEEEVRLQLYRRMAEASTLEQVEEIEQEIRDRFGPLPEAAANLIYILRLRVLAASAGVNQIAIDPDSQDIEVQLPGPGPVRMLMEAGILAGRVRFGRRQLYARRAGGPNLWKKELEEVLLTLVTEAGTLAEEIA